MKKVSCDSSFHCNILTNVQKKLLILKLEAFIHFKWCEGGDLNPHGRYHPLDFKSSASADSATLAYETIINWRRHPDLNWGIEVLQTSALPLGYAADELERERRFELPTLALARRCSTAELFPHIIWCLRAESNCRHEDFQSSALPTELPRQNGDPKGT